MRMPKPITIQFEAEGASETDQKVAALLKRMDGLKESVGEVKSELVTTRSANNDLSASILTGIGRFVASGAAVAVLKKSLEFAIDTVNDYADAVEDTPELFTDDEIDNVKEYRTQVSQLQTEIDKIKFDAAEEALPYVKTLGEGGNFFDFVGKRVAAQNVRALKEELGEVLKAAEGADRAILGLAENAGFTGYPTIPDDEKGDDGKPFRLSVLDITEDLQRSTDRFNTTQDNLMEKQDDTLASILELTEKGYSRWSEEIQGLLGDFDSLNAKMAENSEKQRENTQEMVLNRAKELLSVDGLSEAEELYLIDIGVKRGVYTQQVATDSRKIITDAHAVAGAFDLLDNKQVDIYIRAHYVGFNQQYGAMQDPTTRLDTFGGSAFEAKKPSGVFVEPISPSGSEFDYLSQEVLRRIQ